MGESSKIQDYTILVNSSDGFVDCWDPFFRLFSLYWPDSSARILLNTETSSWSPSHLSHLNIECTRVQKGEDSKRLTWSECLIRALRQVSTPLVLYLQEDYFLERAVDSATISDFARMMLEDPEIKHIGLTHFGSGGPFFKASDDRLWKVAPKAKYRISTQAGLWRVETLLSYLRNEESGWTFEKFGSMRAHRRKELFLTANRDRYQPEKSPILQYTLTGIIKGKWHPAMPALFASHGIEMDFSRRGFYKVNSRLFEKAVILRKMVSNPIGLLRAVTGVELKR